MAADYRKYQAWPNKRPWLQRWKTYYKGVYLSGGETNIPLLKAALSYIAEELNEGSQKKWTRRSAAIPNALNTLVAMSSFALPYTPAAKKHIAVHALVHGLH